MLTGNNGILAKARKAKEETEVAKYYEKIELIRNEMRMKKENYEPPTLAEMQTEFDENQKEWVANTEIKQEEGILQLKTKEGYIFYITEDGTEYKGKIVDATEPNIEAKNTDTSQITRKTNIPLEELFEITWGSDGTGEVEYSITGNLNFKNRNFTSKEITNLSDLELGNYTITCKITSPSNQTKTATKDNVKVIKLATNSVTNASNNNVEASAIYSEYDLAYFRDLVNNGQANINGKLMNDINLSNVCSESIGSWLPIGEYNSTDEMDGLGEEAKTYYAGIFDGNQKIVENIYINNTNLYRQGLFSILKENGTIKNLTTTGNISSYKTAGGIVGLIANGEVTNCENRVTIIGEHQIGGISGFLALGSIKDSTNIASIEAGRMAGGIIGRVEHSNAIVENCYNTARIKATGGIVFGEGDTIKTSFSGGIAGYSIGKINKCLNTGEISGEEAANGGITGRNIRNSFLLLQFWKCNRKVGSRRNCRK